MYLLLSINNLKHFPPYWNAFKDDDTASSINPFTPQPQSVSTPAKKAQAALIPEGLSDNEFLEYYQKLTPADRKKQMFVLKQALLEEQERLKKVKLATCIA